MTWYEKLSENPEFFYKFVTQFSECYLPGSNRFSLCIDELKIFQDLGLNYYLPGCSGDCPKCELDFLINPKIYEFSIKGEVIDG